MKVGFIGFGNMAEAIVKGLLSKGEVKKEDIVVSALHEETLERAKEKFGISVTLSNQEVVDLADYIFLAIKPQYYQKVIEEIRDTYCEEKVFLSIAPGKTLNWLKEQFQKDVKFVRSMPNTPAAVHVIFQDRWQYKKGVRKNEKRREMLSIQWVCGFEKDVHCQLCEREKCEKMRI